MAAKDFKVNDRVHAVILADDNGEAAQHILEYGQALLHMVLAVHAKFRRAAARSDHNGLICTRRDERRRLDHRMRRAGAEAARIGTGRRRKAGDLRRALCKVAAAALVHVAAGFFGAVDHIFDRVLFNARILHRAEESQHGRSFGNQVLMHHVRGKVHVDVVRALHAAHECAVVIQPFGMLFRNEAGDFRRVDALCHARKDRLIHERVCGKRRLVRRNERAVELHEVEHVAGLHEKQELLLRHDLAELAVTARLRALLVIPGLRNFRKRIRRDVADIDLVGVIGERIFKAADMLRQLL